MKHDSFILKFLRGSHASSINKLDNLPSTRRLAVSASQALHPAVVGAHRGFMCVP